MELTMIVLEQNPYTDVAPKQTPIPTRLRTHKYVVKRGDTLDKIVARIAGKGASAAKKKQVRARIIALNPWLKHKRKLKRGDPGYKGTKTITAKPYQLVPGEVLVLPGAASSGGVVSGTGTVQGGGSITFHGT
jgi:hypothetical protein